MNIAGRFVNIFEQDLEARFVTAEELADVVRNIKNVHLVERRGILEMIDSFVVERGPITVFNGIRIACTAEQLAALRISERDLYSITGGPDFNRLNPTERWKHLKDSQEPEDGEDKEATIVLE